MSIPKVEVVTRKKQGEKAKGGHKAWGVVRQNIGRGRRAWRHLKRKEHGLRVVNHKDFGDVTVKSLVSLYENRTNFLKEERRFSFKNGALKMT